MNKNFTFDAVKHEYAVGGVVIPSVTKIMEPLNDFSFVDPDYLETKRKIGIAVHLTIALYIQGKLDNETLSDGNRLALSYFREWYDSDERKSEFGDILFIEEPIYHPIMLYGTTPDLVFEKGLVEIKTRYSDYKKDSVQMAAQSDCISNLFPNTRPEKEILKVFGINFKERKYRLSDVASVDGLSVFKELHRNYNRVEAFEKFLAFAKKRTKKGCQS